MIRLSVIVLPILTVATLACNDPFTPEERARVIPFKTLIQSNTYFDPVEEPAYVVLRSESEEDQFLTSYPRNVSDPSHGAPRIPSFPAVEYDRHLVIGVALGRRGDGNTKVTVDSLVTEGQKLLVYTTELDPCVEQRYFSNPAHFVIVDQRDLEVEFAPTQVVEKPCS